MPPEPPRRGPLPSAVSEPNLARGPHTPVPEAPTSPPPAMPMPPPRGLLEGPRKPLPVPTPPEQRPQLDSLEVSAESLLEALAEKNREAEDLKIKLAASEAGATAQGPKFSLGSAKWWVLVIGALALAPNLVTQVKGWWAAPPVSAPQVDALKASIDELTKTTKATNETLAKRDENDGKRWTLAAAALCAQGFRARGLDCDAVQKYADFQPMPLTGPHNVRGAPQWKADATWPALPIPQE
jgi:hypothetical protein